MAAKQSDAQTRIVLVGRTGADASLRLNPAFELARASTPLEAMGEVAHPMGPYGRTVLVLATEVIEGLRDGGSGTESRLRSFVESLKRLDATLLVMAVNEAGRLLPRTEAGVLDGFLDPAQAAEGIVRVLGRGAVAKPDVVVAPTATRTIEPAPIANLAGPAGGVMAAEGERGDAAVVALAIRGVDISETAIKLIRQRTGDATVVFVPFGGAVGERASVGAIEAAVTWDDQVFGTLVAQGARLIDLASHAKWLAGWMRLTVQQAQLRDAAFKDSLTGAWNRRYFDKFLEAAINHARASRRMVTVMAFDLDNFKHYNDRYGHAAGDEILVETVQLLGSVIRPTDKVCRIGGDEFAVIFDDPEGPRQEGSRHPGSVFDIAHRFQMQIGQHRFAKLGPQAAGKLTISGGLASFPWDGQTAKELLHRADQLAMQSKRQGKNFITLGPLD